MMWGRNPYRQPQSRDENCPRRGPALSHIQDKRVFADGRCIHCQVRLLEPAAEPDPAAERDFELHETGIPPEAEDQPLSLDQPVRCAVNHTMIATVRTPLIGDAGFEWPRCATCGLQCEPALARREYGEAPKAWQAQWGRGALSYDLQVYLTSLGAKIMER